MNGVADTEFVADVRDLRVTFRRGKDEEVHAIRGATLQIRPREIVGLVGESGSGKTVLGQTLMGLTPIIAPRASVTGTIEVGGRDMLSIGKADRRAVLRDRVAAIFQDPMSSLNPSMTIGRQLREACGTTERAVLALEAAGLVDGRSRLKVYPHQLSGGQRQRVMIAMAVARRPALIVADEPTTALDVTVQAQILRLFRDLRDEFGCSIVLVTHDLAVAAEVADRIAVMYGGRILEVGPTSVLMNEPRHPYTQGLMGSRYAMYGSGEPWSPLKPGVRNDATADVAGCVFADRCPMVVNACSAGPDLQLISGEGHRHEAACWRAHESIEIAERPEATAFMPTPSARSADREVVVDVVGAHRIFKAAGRSRRAPRSVALRDVSLSLRRGESLAVVGESGSGKSTLLRALAGLDRLDRGTIERASDLRPQVVFQDAASSLTPWMSVEELLTERMSGARWPTAHDRRVRAVEILDMVGMPHHVIRSRPGALSGGQSQRVAIARCLASDPQLLLADEPTSALDVSLAATILELIAGLRRALNLTLVFVTHDLAIARRVSDRTAVLYRGEVVELGPTEAVLDRPGHPYTQALLGAIPGRSAVQSDAHTGSAPGEPPLRLEQQRGSGCSFFARCVRAVPTCESQPQVLEQWEAEGSMTAAEHREVRCGVVTRQVSR